MTVHTAVPTTHAEPVAPPPLAQAAVARALQASDVPLAIAEAASAQAMEADDEARYAAIRQRWEGLHLSASAELAPLVEPATRDLLLTYRAARAAEEAQPGDQEPDCPLLVARLAAEARLIKAPAEGPGGVAAKIALAYDVIELAEPLTREIAEEIIATPAGIALETRAIASAYLDCLRLSAPVERAVMPRVVKTRHNTFLYLPEAAEDGGEWERAVCAYNSAVAACEALSRRDDAWEAACHAICPPENQYLNEAWGEPWPRYCTMQSFERDDMLPHERARLRPIIEAFAAERERLRIAHEVPRDSHVTDDDPELDAMWEAEERVLTTAPPNTYALAQQQRLAAYCADSPGYDDLGRVMYERADGGCDERISIKLHQHTLLLAGVDDPILHLEPFSPREWLKAFEGAGGVATSPTYSKVVILGTDDMKAEITDPIRRRAVEVAVLERVMGGSDRVFTSDRKRKGPRYSDEIEAMLAGAA